MHDDKEDARHIEKVEKTMEQQCNKKRKKSMAAQRAKRLPLVASQYYQLPAPMPVRGLLTS